MADLDPNLKVLVVDDFPSMLTIIKQILKEVGLEKIETAEDGVKALEILKKKKFDIVLLDWNMPEMTGLEVLQKMRKDPYMKEIPVIMVTAELLKENIVAAARAGVNDYLAKPFTGEMLADKMKKVLGVE